MTGNKGLKVSVRGGNRELLSGDFQGVTVNAQQAVYKVLPSTTCLGSTYAASLGLQHDLQHVIGHLPLCVAWQGLTIDDIKLVGTNIHLNTGAIKGGGGKVLEEPFQIHGNVILMEKDLADSMSSDILKDAIRDTLSLPRSEKIPNLRVSIDDGLIKLSDPGGRASPLPLPIALQLDISRDGRWLTIQPISISSDRYGRSEGGSRRIDLGPGTNVTKLQVADGYIAVEGNFEDRRPQGHLSVRVAVRNVNLLLTN
eukprot:SM000137S00441  [mRNA]  locus=s137:132069:134175:+ [translate_table: standard]